MPKINHHKIHILVANSSEARCYGTSRLGDSMQLIQTYSHPESRKKGCNLVSDRPGHYQSHGTGHGALIEPTPPKEVQAEHFAHELALALNTWRNDNQFQQLVLIAPPHFHGLLNKYCHPQVRERVIFDLEKDYTKITDKQLASHLGDLHRPRLAA